MPEWLNGTVSKTVSRWKSGRGFESLSFRLDVVPRLNERIHPLQADLIGEVWICSSQSNMEMSINWGCDGVMPDLFSREGFTRQSFQKR